MSPKRKAGSGADALDGFTIDLLERGELNRRAEILKAPDRGADFPPGLERSLAKFLSLLGWNRAAEWFVDTPDTEPAILAEGLIEVPRAVTVQNPGEERLRLTAGANWTLMLKNILVSGVNQTAIVDGDVSFARGQRVNQVTAQRFERRMGLTEQRGRWMTPQSVVIANQGIFEIVLRNFDQLSVARFCVTVKGWVILT